MSLEHGGPTPEEMGLTPAETEAPTDQELSTELEATYLGSEILHKRDLQNQRGESFTAAFTDIDNTFYRADRAAVSQEIGRKADELHYPIVAVTGNDFAGVTNRIEGGELPNFDVIIGSVGTEIWVRQEGTNTYEQDKAFKKELQDTGYHRPEIARNVHDFIDQTNTTRPDFHVEYQKPEVETAFLQSGAHPDAQPFKISCFFWAENEQAVAEFTALANEQFPNQALVVCEEIGHNSRLQPGEGPKKYNLDVLPITKAGAVEYVANLLDVKKGIVAGDSGNDTDMLTNTEDLTAVVVGGAKAELVQAVNNETSSDKETSFRKVSSESGQTKAYYVERKTSRLGPDSLKHAAEVLLRAERIKLAKGS